MSIQMNRHRRADRGPHHRYPSDAHTRARSRL